MIQHQIFKEISIGGITKERLVQKLVEAKIQFNKYAETLFEHPSFAPNNVPEKVSLVILKPSDLHISNPFSLEEIINRAANLGLKPCPLYLAGFLRLEYLDQPQGPYLTVASIKPENDENYPNGFYIRNLDSTLWLRGYRTEGDCEWPADNEFIFLM